MCKRHVKAGHRRQAAWFEKRIDLRARLPESQCRSFMKSTPSGNSSSPRPQLWLTLLLLLGCSCLFPLRAAQPPKANGSIESVLQGLAQTSQPLPFKTVIEATTGHRVLDFDTNNPAHAELHAKILRAARLAGERAQKEGITTARANEAGNHIEPFVRAALRECGLGAQVPVTTAGNAQVVGYPDIEITGATPCYLELKTYNATTANTTQRSFYYSPSAKPKVTRDALHLLLAYQLEKQTRDGKTVFLPVHWKLITLENLEVELKFEFNQSNRGLYGKDRSVLADEAIK